MSSTRLVGFNGTNHEPVDSTGKSPCHREPSPPDLGTPWISSSKGRLALSKPAQKASGKLRAFHTTLSKCRPVGYT